MLLCAIAVMFAVPAWASEKTAGTSADLIAFAASTDVTLIKLSADISLDKTIEISRDVSIDGQGHTLYGQNKVSVFLISSDSSPDVKTVTISNLTIKNGSSDQHAGGGMFVVNTNLTLKQVKFIGNANDDNTYDKDNNGGGALAIHLSGDKDYTVSLLSCDFENNVATKQESVGGGGLFIWPKFGAKASFDMEGCTFSKNQAHVGGGAVINTNYINDASDTGPSAKLKALIKNCSFDQNIADKYSGGGLFFQAIRGTMSADVINCTFTKNKVSANGDTNGGGGMEIRAYPVAKGDAGTDDFDINVENCLFEGNEAARGGGLWSEIRNSYENPLSGPKLNVTVKNSTFKGNIASNDYGGGILTALHTHKGTKVTSNDSKINQVVQNCTFIENTANKSGGAMAVRGYNKGSIFNTVANSTFVNNSADVAAEIFVETAGTDTTSNDNTVINALIWNDTPNSKDVVVVSGDKSKLMVKTSAFQSGALSTDVVSDDASKKDLTSLPAASKEVEISGIKHTVYIPSDDSLNVGSADADAKVPTTDIFGVKRSTSKPTVGAAEYVDDNAYTIVASGDVVVDGTILSADISTTFNVEFKVSPDVDSTYTVVWSGDIGVAGLTFSADGKLTGKPTVSADTKFKPVATITTAGGYEIATVSRDFTIKITSADTGEEEGSTSETITLTASSTDVTVYQGGSIDITVTATTSSDNIVWSNSGTLPSGDFTVTSASKTYTIKGTVSTSATASAYTYKVIASNDTSVKSVDIKITVKEKESESGSGATTTYTLSVTVSPDKLSLNRGATSGNTLTATATISPDTTFTPSYQWYSNTTASTSGGTAISSATSATYAAPTSTTGTFYYFVVAKATVSGTALTASSDVVTVTISSGSSSTTSDDQSGDVDSGDTTPDYANMSADEVAELAVDEDGTISQDIVDAILETLTSSDGAVSLTEVAASEQLVAIYAASAKAKSGVVNLSTLPLNSLSGIGTLLTAIADANNTTTSTMTLDLAGQSSSLTKVSGLSGVSLKALTLKNNTHVETVDLSGATIPTVTLEGSAVEELTLGKTANVQKVEASGLESLTSIDIQGNPYIEDLNINQTSISTLNAAGCTSLDNIAASGGSRPGDGSLEELDITSCDNLTQLDVENNKLLGIKKPSPRFAKSGFSFNAGGQRRAAPSGFTLSTSMNFWSILRSLLGLSSSGTIPFTVTTTTVTFTNGGTLDDSTGVVTYTSTPTVFSYYYNPGFTTADTSAFTTAADGSSMDVTIGSASSSTDSGEVTLGSSGGGCDAGFGLGALSAVMLMFALKKKRS